MKNKELARLISKRGMSVERIAKQIFSNRISVTLVLLGRRKGGVTWEKLKSVLEPEELEAAKAFADAVRKEGSLEIYEFKKEELVPA